MAQYKVYRNRRPSATKAPFLLDVQSDLVTTPSRVVIPLARKSYYRTLYSKLSLALTVDGIEVVASAAELAAVDERDLGEPVADLSGRRTEILAAIDFLLTGY
jgi:toxin CcdB